MSDKLGELSSSEHLLVMETIGDMINDPLKEGRGRAAGQLYIMAGVDALRGPLFNPIIAKIRADREAVERSRAQREDLIRPGGHLQVIVTDRGQGKSTALAAWAKAGEWVSGCPTRVVLCVNQKMADLLVEHHGLDERQVCSLRAWREGRRRGHIPVAIAIDDAEFALQEMIGPNPLHCISLTGDVWTAT